MKCGNCGAQNPKGMKFCEKCGKSLTAGKACPKCGFINDPKVQFCGKCGNSLSPGRCCPQCGTLNSQNARFCEKCGFNLFQPQQAHEEIQPAAGSKKRRALSPIVWVLGGMGIVIGLLLAGFLLGLIRIPLPPEPNASILPHFVVSAWTGAYNFQTSGSFAVPAAPIPGGNEVIPLVNANDCNLAACAWMNEEGCNLCGYHWNDFGGNQYCSCQQPNETIEQWCQDELGKWHTDINQCIFTNQNNQQVCGVPYCNASRTNCGECGGSWQSSSSRGAYCQCTQEINEGTTACAIAGGIWNRNTKKCEPKPNSGTGGQSIQCSKTTYFKSCNQSSSACANCKGTWMVSGGGSFCMCDERIQAIDQICASSSIFGSAGIMAYCTAYGKDPQKFCASTPSMSSFTSGGGISSGLNNMGSVIEKLPQLMCSPYSQSQSGPISPPTTGTGCPPAANLSASITDWKKGTLTLELKNSSGWPVNDFSTQLDDAKGNDWVKLTCRRKANDTKTMVCSGSGATYKSGYGTLSFSYGGQSGTCTISSLKFPIPAINVPGPSSPSCPSGQVWCPGGYCSISCP